jgi:hypothetical protein
VTLIEDQTPGPEAEGRRAIWDQVQTLLIPGETIAAYSLQHRVYALLHRRNVATATTGRFIFLKRPLLGGYHPTTLRWQDLKEVRLEVGMFSATVTLTYAANQSDTAVGEGEIRVLRVSGMRIPSAQALYRVCQAEDQAWREKRRVRSIEEMRAAAGGVQIATGVYPGGAPDPRVEATTVEAHPAETPAQRLARAKEMRDQGLISDAEYEAIKARVVSAL